MRFARSLRLRVAASFALLGAVTSVILSIGLYLAGQELEQRLIAESLADEMDDYAALRAAVPSTPLIATRTIRSYVEGERGASEVPAALRALTPGVHEVLLGGQEYFAKVEDRDQQRYYMLYNRSRLHPRARELAIFLATGVVLTTLFAAGGGLWLARRVISPVTELARRVSQLQPEDPPRTHAPDFPADELGELARAFDHYRHRLQAFIEREHSFTGDVSHELRNSLAVINGAAELLLGREGLPQDARRCVERIARAAREMSEVTEALLLLAREADEGAERHPPCHVDQILAEVIEDYRHLLQGKQVALEIQRTTPVELAVEHALLRVAVGNLVRNAFSYTDEGHVRIRLESHQLVIEDTGPGVEPGRASRLFERYYRGEGGAGVGIGLALVKRICDRHGWDVAMCSDGGPGTVTSLRFRPAAPRCDALP